VSVLVLAFLIGVVAGLRVFTSAVAVSWAARLGWLHLEATPLAFLGYAATPWIVSALALFELINDQNPKTPSRKTPPQFIVRVLSGALCGAAIGAPSGSLLAGLIAGALGAVAGTLGGYEVRMRLARAFGKDLPAGLLEDAVAIAAAFFIVSR